ADGSKSGGEISVNTQTANDQDNRAITGLVNGGFVITWDDPGVQNANPDVKAQVFDANGNKLGGEFLVNTQTAGSQQFSSVTGLSQSSALPNGGFVVAWADSSTSAVKAQIFDLAGNKTGAEFVVSTRQVFRLQSVPFVTELRNGNFVVSWKDFSGLDGDNSPAGIKAQIFTPNGTKVGSEFLVNTATAGSQAQSAITALANGDFVVVWSDPSGVGGDASGMAVKAQVFSSNGVKIGGELLVNTFTANDQKDPTVTAFGPNGFVVAWSDSGATNGVGNGVQGQIFTILNTDENTAQPISIAATSTDTDGSESLNIVVSGIPNGAVLSDGHGHSSNLGATSVDVSSWTLGSLVITPPQDFIGNFQLTVTTSAIDSAILSDGTVHTSTPSQRTQAINIIVTPPGTSSSAHVLGTAGNDTLQGSAANDILMGEGGNDSYLFGRGGGQDQIVNGTTGQTVARGELDFGANISNEQLWFQQNGNDLSIAVMGSQDRITVAGWFSSSTSQLAEITTADGAKLDSGLAQLVQAMAAYSAANPGFDPTTATQAPDDSNLQTAIATAWHH
ncbi:MAG TPA: calcium-binding protein, partial [Xanthobacteraceae bacterium]|nr:calcium-binding protein [Xanthobacteraceae bacterium]